MFIVASMTSKPEGAQMEERMPNGGPGEEECKLFEDLRLRKDLAAIAAVYHNSAIDSLFNCKG